MTQVADGPWRRLRGHASIESADMVFRADEIDYNEDTGELQARGSVYFENFLRHERIWADRVDYNTEEEKGKFYNVRGTGKPRIDARPGILTSTEPYYFQGEWAERLGDKYILHNGFITNCKMPRPWWRLKGPRFDIVPGRHAVAYRATFLVRRMPLFFTPFFYKSLERLPRKSGFLMPNIGNSSVRGKMVGGGYYWAINRSYDATYQIQDFTARGFAHHVDLRGKPRAGTDFDAIFFGVQDRGQELSNGERRKQGGYSVYILGKSDLGHGFYGRASVNYLSSLTFRQAFTESFNEAIFSEVHSVGYINKNWDAYSFDAVMAHLENFQSTEIQVTDPVTKAVHNEANAVVVRKLPEFRFSGRDKALSSGKLPFWFSFDSSAGLLYRTEPFFQGATLIDRFQTSQAMNRLNFEPRVMTAVRWKGFHLIPGFALHETFYGQSQTPNQDRLQVVTSSILRSAQDVSVDLVMPSLARVFNKKTFLGDKLKHVVEPRATYRYITGVEGFNRIIRFDETDLLSNTNELNVSLTNRLYAKRGNDVNEVLTWTLSQSRYFDPTFGDAVQAGQRNVVLTEVMLSGYAFLDGPRVASPIVSVVRASPKPGFGFQWRSDFDPARGGIVNSDFSADARVGQYYVNAGHSQVRCVPLIPGGDCHDPSTPRLSPPANQFRGTLGFGNENRRGWNAAFISVYDYRLGVMQYAVTQVTYNTDCCGLSVQYRRFSFGSRNENQFRVAFAVANIGSFGTLKKQERLF